MPFVHHMFTVRKCICLDNIPDNARAAYMAKYGIAMLNITQFSKEEQNSEEALSGS